MAIIKVCGIETEYGILSAGPEQNPIAASSVLVNAYSADIEQKIGWDFEDETPGNDARGFAREGSLAPMVETHLANTVLTNGARFYVDHAHPEYSSPECLTPLECVLYDKAGEEVLRRAMMAAEASHPRSAGADRAQEQLGRQGQLLRLPRELHDGPGRALQPGSSTEWCRTSCRAPSSAGRARSASRRPRSIADTVLYQISQRAEFFEEIVGLGDDAQTTHRQHP